MKITKTGTGTTHWFNRVERTGRTHLSYNLVISGTVTVDVEVSMGEGDTAGKAITGKTASEVGVVANFPLMRLNVTAGTGTATLYVDTQLQDTGA